MNAILDIVLTTKGITFLTLAVLTVFALLYCRIVTGAGLIKGIRSLTSITGSGVNTGVFGNLKKKASALHIGNPSYEEISLTGGDGRGTVAEVLARQTEIKIMKGEEVEDDFMQDLTQGETTIPNYSHFTHPPQEETASTPPQTAQADISVEKQVEPVEKEAPDAASSPAPTESAATSSESSAPLQFSGFSVGDSYDASAFQEDSSKSAKDDAPNRPVPTDP